MDRTGEDDGSKFPPKRKSEKSKRKTDTFTSEMHFIVTRNKRNIWQDDMYDTPPNSADLPVFN
ncbi:hypothetical protein [Desulfosediminicola flagellatus]|uniref:hypothetical protein n=1 Tax=Desulfosediminicola flagellatus TaxID=2569541 RepID=UPI0010AB6151|nr:hypothetical protein [Desulfosediminicola flagellatus]